MHNFCKFFSTTLFEVIVIILQWSGNQSLPLHALNSERCYSHMDLTQQQIQNKLWCCSILIFHIQLYPLPIKSLSGRIIPEVFPLLSLHIKMSNTPKINYFQCQARVSLESRLLGPNHFSPQGWQSAKSEEDLFSKEDSRKGKTFLLGKSLSPCPPSPSLGSPHPSGLFSSTVTKPGTASAQSLAEIV